MSWKRRLRTALDGAARGLGVLRRLEQRRRDQPTVLMHHRVLPRDECEDYPFPSLVLERELFEAELAWLAERFELRTLRGAFDPACPAVRPVAVLTFDDGYRDNYEHAATILERHGARGTFFVAADFVAGRAPLWYDRAAVAVAVLAPAELDEAAQRVGVRALGDAKRGAMLVRAWVEALKRVEPAARSALIEAWETRGRAPSLATRFAPMTPAQVGELAARGHEIGAHSLSHAMLPQCSDVELANELERSRAQIAGWCGGPVDSFCYPDGAHDERVVAATARAGFRLACTTRAPFGAETLDRLRIPRVDITRERLVDGAAHFDPLALRAELAGFHEALR